MTIKVGALEAKNKFSELMETVAYTKQRVLVERRGKPMAAIVSVADLARLETMESEAAQKNRQKEIDEYFAEARKLRAWWLDKLGGQALPPAADLLREAREEGLE